MPGLAVTTRSRARRQTQTQTQDVGKRPLSVPAEWSQILTMPLSQLPEVAHIPVLDTEALVNRSVETRQQEVVLQGKRKAHLVGRILRPVNSFILYRNAYADRALAACKLSRRDQRPVSYIAGASWRMETPEIKAKFAEWAEMERVGHLRAFPEYKFTPSKPQPPKSPIPSDDESDGEDIEDTIFVGGFRPIKPRPRVKHQHPQRSGSYQPNQAGPVSMTADIAPDFLPPMFNNNTTLDPTFGFNPAANFAAPHQMDEETNARHLRALGVVQYLEGKFARFSQNVARLTEQCASLETDIVLARTILQDVDISNSESSMDLLPPLYPSPREASFFPGHAEALPPYNPQPFSRPPPPPPLPAMFSAPEAMAGGQVGYLVEDVEDIGPLLMNWEMMDNANNEALLYVEEADMGDGDMMMDLAEMDLMLDGYE